MFSSPSAFGRNRVRRIGLRIALTIQYHTRPAPLPSSSAPDPTEPGCAASTAPGHRTASASRAVVPACDDEASERGGVPVPVQPGCEPFAFEGGKVGALMVHGFTGRPYSMRPWGEYLAAIGLSVLGPRLPG